MARGERLPDTRRLGVALEGAFCIRVVGGDLRLSVRRQSRADASASVVCDLRASCGTHERLLRSSGRGPAHKQAGRARCAHDRSARDHARQNEVNRHRHEHAQICRACAQQISLRAGRRDPAGREQLLAGHAQSCSRGARNRSGRCQFWSQMSSRERISKDSERHRAAAAHEAGGSRTRARTYLCGRNSCSFEVDRSCISGACSGNGSRQQSMKEARGTKKRNAFTCTK